MKLAAWPVGCLLAATAASQTPHRQRRIPPLSDALSRDHCHTECAEPRPNQPCSAAIAYGRSSLPAFAFPPSGWASLITDATNTLRNKHKNRSTDRNFLRRRITTSALTRSPTTTTMASIIVPSEDGGDDGGLNGGGVRLWLDMRTSILPAQQALKSLYDELRRREEAKGHTPEDSNWLFKRVPNPVGAVLFAAEPEGRAAQEGQDLIAGGLRCFMVTANDDQLLDVATGEAAGISVDPAGNAPSPWDLNQQIGGGGSGGSDGGINAAVAAAAMPMKTNAEEVLLLHAVKPTSWTDADMPALLRITASTCAGSGKTLVVTIRSVGQLHDTTMAALAAAQTKLLGPPLLGGGDGDRGGGVALLIEPSAELWEAGLMYL